MSGATVATGAKSVNADVSVGDPSQDELEHSLLSKKKLWASRSVSGVDDLHFNNNRNIPNGSDPSLESPFLTRGNSDTPDESLIPRSIEDYYAAVEVLFLAQKCK